MDQHQIARLWAARRASNRLAKRCFVALVVVMVLVLVLAEPDGPHDLAWFAATAGGVTAVLLWAVVVATISFSFVVANPAAYQRGRDHRLPRLGSVARLVNRVSVRLFWLCFLALPLAVLAFQSIGEAALLWDEQSPEGVADPIQGASGLAFVVAFLAAVVWLYYELRGGYREPRPRREVTSRGRATR